VWRPIEKEVFERPELQAILKVRSIGSVKEKKRLVETYRTGSLEDTKE
jgi:hypothetical protein